jgi:hypothetical protein
VAEAYVLEVLPRDLIFLFSDIFRCPKHEVFAWLVNIGHGLLGDLLRDLRSRAAKDLLPAPPVRNSDQLCLAALLTDDVALPILEKAAVLESAVEIRDPKSVEVRYVGRET